MARRTTLGLPTSRRDPDGRVILESTLSRHPGWNLWAAIDDSDGVAEIVELAVIRQDQERAGTSQRGVAPSGSVSAAILRSISIPDVIAAADLHLRAMHLLDGTKLKRLRDPNKMSERNPEYYATWARLYVTAVREHPNRAIAALAEAQAMEPSAVRDLIHRCRSKGYLTPGARGRAGGQLTDLAIQTLKETPR